MEIEVLGKMLENASQTRPTNVLLAVVTSLCSSALSSDDSDLRFSSVAMYFYGDNSSESDLYSSSASSLAMTSV